MHHSKLCNAKDNTLKAHFQKMRCELEWDSNIATYGAVLWRAGKLDQAARFSIECLMIYRKKILPLHTVVTNLVISIMIEESRNSISPGLKKQWKFSKEPKMICALLLHLTVSDGSTNPKANRYEHSNRSIKC
jgi:hypothetical protein